MNRFVLMWDMHGIEYVGSIDNPLKQKTWAILKGEKQDVHVPNLNHLVLRARSNPQRHYEIYIVDSDESVDTEDLLTMFRDDPQSAADLIRERGHCYYDDRISLRDKPVIT
jgi:hypothetical protein